MIDRRRFLASALAAGFSLRARTGLAFPPLSSDPAARSLIHIYLRGGLSQLDSFDPKPGAPVEVRGPFGTVASKIDGEPFSSGLRRTADIADRLCVIRSMTHGEAAHERGSHSMLTGYRPSPAITYPSLGSIVAHELGGRNKLPPYICIPGADDENAGTGYLGSSYAPFSLAGDPARRGFRVRDLALPEGVGDDRLARRRRLLRGLDESFEAEVSSDGMAATRAFYEQAYDLIESPEARAAFDLDQEPNRLRDEYGRSSVGQKLLLARRLVEGGARLVTVFDGGWDHHRDIARALNVKLRGFDQAFARLIRDLEQRKLLDQTLVLVTTEFGRTPRVNRDRGRDHWPKVFSVVLAGADIRRGLVHGASDPDGAQPDRDPVSPADLFATVYSRLGIDPTKKIMSPGDRPIDIVREGRILSEILA
ncbi:MAG: DUF1501 domain-containing protein [Planctomycetes bacterium]|nr:DUF1501 domain-containing protein [Planctomycetota bacterium]